MLVHDDGDTLRVPEPVDLMAPTANQSQEQLKAQTCRRRRVPICVSESGSAPHFSGEGSGSGQENFEAVILDVVQLRQDVHTCA